MIIESFLIFLSTLVSLNMSTDQSADDQNNNKKTEINDDGIISVNNTPPPGQGGWDRN